MQTFTGSEYVKIDVASQFGLDKKTWNERLDWFEDNEGHLMDMRETAKNPLLYTKAVNAWDDTKKGKETGYIMSLDATASGLQIMSCLIGCKRTAWNVNLINSGKRMNPYGMAADEMSKFNSVNVTSDDVKYPLMTVFYGSRAKPKQLFGEDTPELKAFYVILDREFPGAMRMMQGMLSLWDTSRLVNQWRLPDGHTAYVRVMGKVDKRIEVDEFDHASFTYRTTINTPVDFSLAIPANIVQSIDGYIVRQMLRGAKKRGFQLATIHDSFWSHPNHMNTVRKLYVETMADLAESNIMQDILMDLRPERKIQFNKISNDLGAYIRESDYALS